MTALETATVAELVAELSRRGGFGRCQSCRRWRAYMGRYDEDGETLRCHGCLRAVAKCTCR